MKKTFRNYLTVWAVLVVLFNLIAFVAVGWSGREKYTASFWIGYVGITLMLAGQLVCARKVFMEENLQKIFYRIPVFRIGYHGLIWSFVLGGACMLLPMLPYWVGTILCAIVLAVTAIAVLKADTAADLVEKTDEKIKTQTSFIRLLTADAENLLPRAKSEEAKAACRKVYEAVRYSDPMSTDALVTIEGKISAQMDVLTEAVLNGDEESIAATVKEIVALLGERSRKCKVLK